GARARRPAAGAGPGGAHVQAEGARRLHERRAQRSERDADVFHQRRATRSGVGRGGPARGPPGSERGRAVSRDIAPTSVDERWAGGAPPGADELDQLVYLSNLVGREPRLVQPGGGNTSIKLGDELLVKGSGTDLRTIGREGFTRLSLSALAALRD